MKKYVGITVDGKEYKIRFSMNNIIELEEKMGMGISNITGETFKELRTMVYCTFSPKFESEAQAGEFMDDMLEELSMQEFVAKMLEAMQLGMGKQKKMENKVEM